MIAPSDPLAIMAPLDYLAQLDHQIIQRRHYRQWIIWRHWIAKWSTQSGWRFRNEYHHRMAQVAPFNLIQRGSALDPMDARAANDANGDCDRHWSHWSQIGSSLDHLAILLIHSNYPLSPRAPNDLFTNLSDTYANFWTGLSIKISKWGAAGYWGTAHQRCNGK